MPFQEKKPLQLLVRRQRNLLEKAAVLLWNTDSVAVEERELFPVILKAKSGNDGSPGKSEARSFAEETNQ